MSEMSGELSLQPNRRRAWIASVGIIAHVAGSCMFVGFQLVEHYVFPDWENSDSLLAALFALTAAGSGLGVLVAILLGIIGYLLWLNRAAWNARALGVVLRETPRASVVCWFIPFVNLFKPYHVVKSLYVRTDPDEALRNDSVARWPWLFPVWWGTWVTSSILDNISFRLSFKEDPGAQLTSIWLNLVSAPFLTVAGATAVMIIWSIEARLGRLAERAGAPPRFVLRPEPSANFAGN